MKIGRLQFCEVLTNAFLDNMDFGKYGKVKCICETAEEIVNGNPNKGFRCF